MMPKENALYPTVADWLTTKYRCFKTAQNTGLKYSRADVIGIRDIGGDLTGEIETIIVEVKRGIGAFATASGQAFGYTVYANRVYLADFKPDGFSPEEIQIASHLGIGLIVIGKNNKCSEVLSSPYYKPITRLNTLLLEKMRLGKCQLCDCYIEIGDETRNHNYLTREKIDKALESGKGVIFWNRELGDRKNRHGVTTVKEGMTRERRFLCIDCLSLLSQFKQLGL